MTLEITKIKRKLSPQLSNLMFSFAEESSGILLIKSGSSKGRGGVTSFAKVVGHV